MTRTCFLLTLLVYLSTSVQAATKQVQGWQEIPNTSLQSVCPAKGYHGVDYNFSFYCQNVTAAWNGGAFDSKRNRLYIWGGGHTDYMGNEIYALDLNQNKMLRLTSPATPLADRMSALNPSELTPYDGTQPNSRHIYDAMVYLPNEDRVWVFSGSLATSGGTDSVTWIFNPNTNKWKRVTPKGTQPMGNYGIVSAYNPNTGDVILHDQHGLYSYHYSSHGGTYTRLVDDRDYGIHLSAEFDPVRNVFVMIGGEQAYLYDLTPGKPLIRNRLITTGDNEIINSQAPGLAYDPKTKQIIAWAGGNKVYALNLDARSWTAIPHSGDPGPALCNGTYGRWAYSAKSNAFVVYNWYENNAFLLRLKAHDLAAVQAIERPVYSARTEDSRIVQNESENRLQRNTIVAQSASNSDNSKSQYNSLVLMPSMDTYLSIYQDHAGETASLKLSTRHRILIKFSDPALNSKTQVRRALLRMHQQTSRPMSPVYTGVFLGKHDWQEDSNWNYSNPLTKTKWLSSPGDWLDRSGIDQGGQPFDLQQVIVKPDGQWLEWEVTELVKKWQAGSDTSFLGIVIKSLSGQDLPILINSRESEDTSLRPQLVVDQVD